MKELLLNGWQYSNKVISEQREKGAEDVVFPHGVYISSKKLMKSKFTYTKVLKTGELAKRSYLMFDGFLGNMTVIINKRKVGQFTGIGLPARVDITKALKANTDNNIILKFDCNLNKSMVKKEDTDCFMGITDKVWLETVGEVHIARNVEGKTYTKNFIVRQEGENIINVDLVLTNEGKANSEVTINAVAIDMDKRKVAKDVTKVTVKKGASVKQTVKLLIDRPELWSVDQPYLYTIGVRVEVDGKVCDTEIVKRGLRTFAYDKKKGVSCNGAPLKLVVTNYAPLFPEIGISNEENAIYRDLFKLKKAGINAIRCINYPASTALLEVCDRLGLVVINTLPNTVFFKKDMDVVKGIHTLAVRDIGRTSVAIWDITIVRKGCPAVKLTKYVGKELFKMYGKGNHPLTIGVVQKKVVDIPYNFYNHKTKKYENKKSKKYSSIINTYGMEKEQVSSCDRNDGEINMLFQAWNYQFVENNNNAKEKMAGNIIERAIDSHNGYTGKVKSTGIMDEYRLPKFSYYFLMSQNEDNTQKFCYAPTFWDKEALGNLIVYSNCEKTRLYVNDKFVGELSADLNKDKKGRAKKAKKLNSKNCTKEVKKVAKKSDYAKYLKKAMFANTDSNNLVHPPFIFENVEFVPGEIVVDGIVKNEVCARHIVRTPGVASALRVRIDYSGRELINNGADFVFVHVDVVDNNGTLVNDSSVNVTLSANGGRIIGTNTKTSVAGVASFVMKANVGVEELEIFAKADGLNSNSRLVRVLDKAN